MAQEEAGDAEAEGKVMLQRRGLLAGLGALLAAPAIIRTPGLLMPVRPVLEPVIWGVDWGAAGGDFTAGVLMRPDGSVVATWSCDALPSTGQTLEMTWRATVDGKTFFDVPPSSLQRIGEG